MREIGSEFWDIPVCEDSNDFWKDKIQWYTSGRSALCAVVDDLQKNSSLRSVAIPSWCCESMIMPFVRAGFNVRFYPVYWKNNCIQRSLIEADIVFVMDYFGYSMDALDLAGFKGVVIRDVTHSIFSHNHTDADYYFGSLRKWGGFWTGGYVWTKDGRKLQVQEQDNQEYINLRMKAMDMKLAYLNRLDESNSISDKSYLGVFDKAEEILNSIGMSVAADRDIQMAMRMDISTIKTKRRRNSLILRRAFSNQLIFSEMAIDDCPLFVPIYVPDGKRDELRQFLISKKIFCPVHWSLSKYHNIDELSKWIYNNELSLVCDQRYTEEDMYRMVDAINAF